MNQNILGDCLIEMKNINSNSIDLILTDLPYGMINQKWDTLINLNDLWTEYKRIIKPNGVICLTAKEPFSSILRISNINMYKYDYKWIKTRPSRYVLAKKLPLSYYEDILIFYDKFPTYNPQFTEGKSYKKSHKNTTKNLYCGTEKRNGTVTENKGFRYPSDVLYFSNSNSKSLHPTQKPIDLFEFLIKTYTNENDIVLDSCAGSFTTAIACINTNRNYICIEKDEKYFNIGINRINTYLNNKSFL
jgi:DNA modification methylase